GNASLLCIRLIGAQHLLGKRHALRWAYEYRSRANPRKEGISYNISAEEFKADPEQGLAHGGRPRRRRDKRAVRAAKREATGVGGREMIVGREPAQRYTFHFSSPLCCCRR